MNELNLVLSNGREIPLQPGRITIGRGAGNNVVLNVTQVSRRHAEIRYDGRDCLLVDLGSTNGTAVDGRALTPHQPYPLRPGSVVSMGGQAVFRIEESIAEEVPFYSGEEPPARASTSPWIFVLGGLAAVLLVALVVVAALLLRAQKGEGTQTAGASPVAAVATATAPPVGGQTQPTAEVLPPTALLIPTPPPSGAGGQVPPAAGGQPPPGGQVPQLTSIVPTLQGWATSLAPLFPAGTPGALPGTERYAAPILVSPDNGASFQGQDAAIFLTWQSVGHLKADEYYNVSMRYSQNGQIQFAGGWVQKTEWRVPDWLFGRADQGRFEWNVTVHQAFTIRQDGSKEGPAISPKSETRFFIWTEKEEKAPTPEGPSPTPEGPSPTPEFDK